MYLDAVKFKTKHLRTLLIFTLIPLDAQEVWSLNQLYAYVLKRMKESPTLTSMSFHVTYCSSKILYVSFIITDYLIGLAVWAFPIWDLVCALEWDQTRTNKTLAPMGLGLFCQLLTSLKLPLIIFNTTI